MSIRIGLASTIRNPGPAIRSFVQYHLMCGIEKIYIFLDDPDDPCIDDIPLSDCVDVIPCDSHTRSCWADLPSMRDAELPNMQDHVTTEVMARQILNVELALQLARAEGLDWLLHLDADEVIYMPGLSVRDYFAAQPADIQKITFLNYEAQVETIDVTDYLREVTLFKRNALCIATDTLTRAKEIVRDRTWSSERWFLYYAIGKSAVRVLPGARPDGVHNFTVPNHLSGSITTCVPAILHYINAGFENFWTKYRTWGHFADTWFGKTSIKDRIGALHLESRDIVATDDRHRAREFYRQRFVASDRELVDQLVAIGAFERIPQVSWALAEVH